MYVRTGETTQVGAKSRRLIADARLHLDWEVRHSESAGRSQTHVTTPFARVVGDRLVYDGDAAKLTVRMRRG